MATYRGNISKNSAVSREAEQNRAGHKWINRACIVAIIIFIALIIIFNQQYTSLLR